MNDDGKTPEIPIESPNLSPSSDEAEADTSKVSAALPEKEPVPERAFRPQLSGNSELGRNCEMPSESPKTEPSASTHTLGSPTCQERDSGDTCISPTDPLTDRADQEITSEEAAADASVATGVKDENQSNEEKLDCLKKKISENWKQCEKLHLEVGKYLLEAKDLFGKHGDWLDWLKANVPFSIRQAQRLMRVAERFGNNATPVSHLDFSKAYILTRLPETKEEDFLKSLTSSAPGTDPLQIVQDLSKRELENKIRDYISALPVSRHTQEVAETEVNTSTAAGCSKLNVFICLRDQMNGLLQEVLEKKVDDSEYDTLIAEIRELCSNTLSSLSSTDVEPE